MYDQGEIVLIPFPYSDLTASKKRPALIVSNRKIHEKMPDRICCLVTSNNHRENVIIRKEDILEGNLPFESSIKPQRIFTIDSGIIIKSLCKIREELHLTIVEKINEFIV